ncbi:MAG: TonB-dependent receptor [Ignavibacteria bacterium]|nr:TonB-dependent receptor [Ignavibacteria bacterium]
MKKIERTCNSSFVLLLAFTFVIYGSVYAQVSDSTSTLPLEQLLHNPVKNTSHNFQHISEIPSSITVISREDILLLGSANLSELLQNIRSFYLNFDEYTYYIGVRGYNRIGDQNNRILLLINGHTYNESVHGSGGFGYDCAVDIQDVERVEIVRGPGEVIYGNNAVFAVINVITRSAESIGKLNTDLGLGTDKRVSVSLLHSGVLAANSEYTLSARFMEAAGSDYTFSVPEKNKKNPETISEADKEQAFSVYGNWQYSELFVQAGFNYRDKNLPTVKFKKKMGDTHESNTDYRGFVDIHYDKSLNEATDVSIRGYFDSYRFERNYPRKDWSSTVTNYSDKNSVDWVGCELRCNYSVTDGCVITAGTEIKADITQLFTMKSENSTLREIDQKSSSFAAYIQNDYQIWPSFSTTIGARLDKITNLSAIVSPRAGLIYKPWMPLTAKALYSTGFRSPTIYENSYFVTDSVSFFSQPSNLQTEKIKSFELVAEYDLNELFFITATAFRNNISDVINYYMPDFDVSQENLASYAVDGAEFELATAPLAHFKFGINYTRQYIHQNDNSVIDNVNIPGHFGNITIAYLFSHRFSVCYSHHFEDSRTLLNGKDLNSISLGMFAVRGIFSEIGLSMLFRVTNIFNEKYSYPAGNTVNPLNVIPQDGREFQLHLQYNLP